jgi:hypothetical protein
MTPFSVHRQVKGNRFMIEVHYWPTPNGKKVTILLEELAGCGNTRSNHERLSSRRRSCSRFFTIRELIARFPSLVASRCRF